MAEISFYYSTMAAGKSTAALQLNYSLKQAGFKPQLFKPAIDTRDAGVIRSRIGLESACTLIDRHVSDVVAASTTHIIIDEAQFLTKEQVNELWTLSDAFVQRPIYCYGLRTAYTGELFEGAAALMAIADNLIEMPLISWDGNKTVMHIRYVNGEPIFEGDPIFVGDIVEEYRSVSRQEYFWTKNGFYEE